MNPIYEKKQREYEAKKARAKALALRLTCTICGAKPRTLLNCPCGTTQYCSTDCQRIDWRDRGHRKACKKIRNERAAEAARAEAPTPPPSLPVYGPAPRSHADEVRARIAAEHEAARARREAQPEPEPMSRLNGLRCPVCFEDWDVNKVSSLLACCCRRVCVSCAENLIKLDAPCPLCRSPTTEVSQMLTAIRRHVENEVPEAIQELAGIYRSGGFGIAKNDKKAAKLHKRAAELGDVDAMNSLGLLLDAGRGVKLDKKKAMRWYRAAADRGHAMAQFNLAVSLRAGGPETQQESVEYLTRAAQQGFTEAEYNLGLIYGKGEIMEPDVDEAKRWLRRAAAKGYELAIEILRQLESCT